MWLNNNYILILLIYIHKYMCVYTYTYNSLFGIIKVFWKVYSCIMLCLVSKTEKIILR